MVLSLCSSDVVQVSRLAVSNRQSAVKVQGRESEVKGLVVLPGLPVSKGSPVRDERAWGLLSIPAPTDEEAVCVNNSNRHPNPHIIHHLGAELNLSREIRYPVLSSLWQLGS